MKTNPDIDFTSAVGAVVPSGCPSPLAKHWG